MKFIFCNKKSFKEVRSLVNSIIRLQFTRLLTSLNDFSTLCNSTFNRIMQLKRVFVNMIKYAHEYLEVEKRQFQHLLLQQINNFWNSFVIFLKFHCFCCCFEGWGDTACIDWFVYYIQILFYVIISKCYVLTDFFFLFSSLLSNHKRILCNVTNTVLF